MTDDTITVNLSLTEQDVINLFLHHSRTSPHFRKQYKSGYFGLPVFMLVLVLVCGVIFYVYDKIDNFLEAFTLLPAIFSYIFIIGWLIAFPYVAKLMITRNAKAMIKEGKNRLEPSTLTISKDFIIDKDNSNELKYSWKSIVKIDLTTDYIFIFAQSSMAFIIPKRMFGSQEEQSRFIQRINEYHQSANT